MKSKKPYFDRGKSNPETGSNFHPEKKGIVPRPAASGYSAGTVEAEGNKIVKIADSPDVFDRESGKPKSATDTLGKVALHGHHAGVAGRGRPYKYSAVKTAEENVGAAKRARAPQIASNGRLGN